MRDVDVFAMLLLGASRTRQTKRQLHIPQVHRHLLSCAFDTARGDVHVEVVQLRQYHLSFAQQCLSPAQHHVVVVLLGVFGPRHSWERQTKGKKNPVQAAKCGAVGTDTLQNVSI